MLRKTNKLKEILLLIIFSTISAIFIFKDDGYNYNFYILLINFIIVELSLIKVFWLSRYPYSLDNFFLFFFIFFLGIAPAQQFKKNIIFWDANINLTETDYFYGNLSVLLCLLLYFFLYNYYQKERFKKNLLQKKRFIRKPIKLKFLFLLLLVGLSLLSFFIFSYSNNFNLISILFRGGFSEIVGEKNISDSSLSQIINIFVRPIPLICLIVYKFYKTEKGISFIEVILIIITLFSNSPTGMARFQAAALYIPVILVYSKKIRKPLNLAILFCLGFLIIFPFLDQFRTIRDGYSKLELNTDMFVEGHFDSYQTTIAFIKYDEITYGRQLLGALFFYVPRSVWPEKPMGSGALTAKNNNYSWANISMSWFGEGYVNFGFLGVFLFTIIIAYFNSKMDMIFWLSSYNSIIFKLFYPLMLGMEFFILRGDLLSSFAYTIGLYLSVIFVINIVTRKLPQ